MKQLHALEFVVVIFVTFFKVSLAGEVSPLLFWGSSSSILKPALNELPSEDFTEIIKSKLDDFMTIVFQEGQLTSEDLSLCKIDGKTCFQNLAAYSPRSYFLSVENPIDAIKVATRKREYVTINSDSELATDVVYETGKVVFVTLRKNSDLSRAELLKEHDKQINEIYSSLSAQGKVLGIYTAQQSNKQSLVRRTVRQIAENQPARQESAKPVAFNVDNKVLIYYEGIALKEAGKEPVEIHFETASLTAPNGTTYNVVLTGGTNKLSLEIVEDVGYWGLVSVKFNDEAFSRWDRIVVPLGLSYSCSLARDWSTVETSSKSLQWTGLQIEPRFSNFNEEFVFHDAYNCVGFMSTGIIAGLFVTFLLLLILSYGITWMMDINTMDRFDDPKGKTITITTTD